MKLEKIGDTPNLLDKDEVAAVTPAPDNPDTMLVLFKSGAHLYYKGEEMREVWKFLYKGDDWRGDGKS